MAQGRQRICGLARLGYEQRKAAFLQHGVAIAKFRRDVDVDGHAGEGFEPVFCDHAGIIAGSAGNYRDALYARQVEIHLRQGNCLFQWANVARERLRDHSGLLKNLFLHVMAVIALFDLRGGHTRGGDFAFYRMVVLVENLCAVACDNHPVAFLQISDFLRQWRKGKCVRTQISFAIAIADDQRAAEPRANQEIGKLAKRNRQRKGSAQTRKHRLHRIGGRMASLDLLRHQMRHNFGIGFAFERPPARRQFVAELLEILDNAIVDQGHFARRMRMRVACGWRAMCGPTGMCDAYITSSVIGLEHVDEIGQLALRTAADELTVKHRADTGTVIAAIFHSLQPIDQPVRDRRFANNSNNAAHLFCFPICFVGDPNTRHLGRKILRISCNEYAP